jgi:hypothetical protein
MQKIPHPVLYTRTAHMWTNVACLQYVCCLGPPVTLYVWVHGPILEIRAHVMVYGIPPATIWGSRPSCTEMLLP